MSQRSDPKIDTNEKIFKESFVKNLNAGLRKMYGDEASPAAFAR